jgi:hypothetical protein
MVLRVFACPVIQKRTRRMVIKAFSFIRSEMFGFTFKIILFYDDSWVIFKEALVIAELLDFEAEWDPEPIRIPVSTGINLSCADLDALEGLVEFYEEEDHERDHDQRAE